MCVFNFQVFGAGLNDSAFSSRDSLSGDLTGFSTNRKSGEKGGGASLKENVCQVKILCINMLLYIKCWMQKTLLDLDNIISPSFICLVYELYFFLIGYILINNTVLPSL